MKGRCHIGLGQEAAVYYVQMADDHELLVRPISDSQTSTILPPIACQVECVIKP